MMRKMIVAVFAVVVAIFLFGVGSLIYLRTSLPQTDGTVTLDGLTKPVEIVRDENAVPHIKAQSELDAYFALGYVHAQDRLWQMEFMRRLGAGKLSEVLGPAALGTDRYIRTLGLYRIAEANYKNASAQVRSALEAYAAGVNAWLSTRPGALPPEFILLRFQLLSFKPEDWRPADSLVWSRLMALGLGRNRKNERLRARIAKRFAANGLDEQKLVQMIEQLWPDDPSGTPTQAEQASLDVYPSTGIKWSALDSDLPDDSGSNGWVVHGQHTDSGKPILANDPHLRFGAPILWYLARVEAPGLMLTGATVPGVPFTLLGHNGSIAWGITNGGSDVEDIFSETIDPADPNKYLIPGGSELFRTRQEVINVSGAESVAMTVRESRHGPIISDIFHEDAKAVGQGEVAALASAALRFDDSTTDAVYAINRARNWHEFRAAAEHFHSPQINLTFASTKGDIGFIAAGRVPIRKTGDGRMPVAGHDGRHDWTGFIPARALPHAFNPPSGRVVNANNRIAGYDYPYLLTRDWALPYRAERIVELLDGKAEHTLADSQDLQRDVFSPAARKVMPILLQSKAFDSRSHQALELLSKWDFQMRRDRPEPLIYTVWLHHLVSALIAGELGNVLTEDYLGLVFRPAPRFAEVTLANHHHWCEDTAAPSNEPCSVVLASSLRSTLDEIAKALGPSLKNWRWGALHHATFQNRILNKVPIVRKWANLSIESDGGNHTVNRGSTAREKGMAPFSHTDGAGYRAVYDLSDLENSVFMIASGQSGNVLSPRYGDFLRRWRDGEYFRITSSHSGEGDLAARTLQLVPADDSSLGAPE